MFYVKEPIHDAMEVTIEINDENVFCRCPVCGREVLVIWRKSWAMRRATCSGQPVLCEDCARELMEVRDGDGSRSVTPNTIPTPTAYQAIRNAEPARFSVPASGIRVFAYAGDVEANTARARRYCRYVTDQGGIPLAPHLYLPQFLDEKTERDLALFMDIALLSKCAELWVFGDIISDGMQKEIEYARRKRKPCPVY
jgi:hypothetical protein